MSGVTRIIKSTMRRVDLIEFHRSFKPLFYLMKICGLLPTQIDVMNGSLVIIKSTFGIVQTVTFIVVYSGLIYFMRKNDITVMKLQGVSMLVEQIQLCALNITFYVVSLPTLTKHNEFLEIVKSVSKLDSLLVEIGEKIDYRKEFWRCIIMIGSLCAILGIVGGFQILINYKPGLEYIFHSLLWFPPLFFMQVTLLQFAVMVFSVKLRCVKLNNAVSKMLKNFDSEPNLSIIANVEVDQRNIRAKYRGCNINDTIRNVSDTYDHICEICKTINRVFSLRITFALGVMSIFLTFIIHGFAVHVKNDYNDPYKWVILVTSGLILILNTTSMFGIIYCCSEMKSEAEQVVILLHRVKSESMEDREAINAFSLRSMHQKVQLTASGLFNLDYTFIYLVISTITTYMVILVQFGQ